MIECLADNFQYEVSYTYDTSYTCHESGCNEEGICRCGEIINEVVTDVDIFKITNRIYESIFDKSISTKRHNLINSVLWGITEEIEKYTIDRILRANKIWNTAKWEIKICNGYYGQEVDSVNLRPDVVEKLQTDLENGLNISNLTERIEFLLSLENGWILDEIKDSTYTIKEINKDDIIFGNLEHYKKVQRQDIEFYSDRNYKGIKGIVKKDGDKWKIIDGYHRLSKTESKMVKVLICQ